MVLWQEVIVFWLPILAAGLIHHLVIIPQNRLKFLLKAVDSGNKFRGQPVLGPKKTWRGIVVMIVASSLFFQFETIIIGQIFILPAWLAGLVIGSGYALAELPNSFLKRQVGIKSGAKTSGLFQFIDHLDSVFGSVLALSLIYQTNISLVLSLVCLGGMTHWSVDRYLKHRGYKKSLDQQSQQHS